MQKAQSCKMEEMTKQEWLKDELTSTYWEHSSAQRTDSHRIKTFRLSKHKQHESATTYSPYPQSQSKMQSENSSRAPGIDFSKPLNWNDPAVIERMNIDRNRYQYSNFLNAGIIPSAVFECGIPQTGPQSTPASFQGPPCSANETHVCQLKDDDEEHLQIRYAKTINPDTGEWYCIQIMKDTGAGENWIPPWMVRGLDVEKTTIETREVQGFDGTTFRSSHMVSLQLAGKDNTVQDVDFYVAPEGFPFQGVTIGRNGPSEGHFLEQQPKNLALLVMQKTITVSLERGYPETLTDSAPCKESEKTTIQVTRLERERTATRLEQEVVQSHNRKREGRKGARTSSSKSTEWAKN
ncbi:hypothetical protein BT63DRAFT_304420 [Microthyrium microscopicum]|uniref:Uncharacterized protein n=1 Tax=Microthyrium microscopicum TaxID=703497 RepID=A0A6A6U6U2_9PEZI|nr:hypothetical protein BT63DRAFT_304420 [Microthyrium microscopicum]